MTELYVFLSVIFFSGAFIGMVVAFFFTGAITIKRRHRRTAGLDVNRILSGQTKNPFDKPQ